MKKIENNFKAALALTLFFLSIGQAFALVNLAQPRLGEVGVGPVQNTLCQPCVDPNNPQYSTSQCQVIRSQMVEQQAAQRTHMDNAQGIPGTLIPTQTSPNIRVNPFAGP